MLGQTVDEKIKNCRRRKEKKSHRTFLPKSSIRLVVYHNLFFNNNQFRHIGKIE